MSGRRHTGLALAVVIVLETAAGASVLYLRSRDRATAVPVQDAVSRYRAARALPFAVAPAAAPAPTAGPAPATATTTTPAGPPATSAGRVRVTQAPAAPATAAPPAAAGSVPAPGVYVYDTTGGEQVDSFGGARHDYPAQTTITLSPDGCGQRVRWDALQQRWDEQTTCRTAAGEENRTWTTYHDFFGHSDRRDYRCEPGSLSHPATYEPGASWAVRCAATGTTSTGVVRVVELVSVQVGDQPVDAAHLALTTTEQGSTRGKTVWDLWLRRSDGLLLRRVVSVDAESDSPVGTVKYAEHYELRLRSLTPSG